MSDTHRISPKSLAPQYQLIERKMRKRKKVEDYIVGIVQRRHKKKRISPALETRQSHTIEYDVSKIIPEDNCEGNKSPVVLRGSAARRRISVPMCDQGTECNPHWNIRSW